MSRLCRRARGPAWHADRCRSPSPRPDDTWRRFLLRRSLPDSLPSFGKMLQPAVVARQRPAQTRFPRTRSAIPESPAYGANAACAITSKAKRHQGTLPGIYTSEDMKTCAILLTNGQQVKYLDVFVM